MAYGVVYIGSFGGNFYAINATTGGELWGYTTGGDVWSSPAVANGIVYVGTNDHYLYAFNANTGAKLWSFLTGGGVFSSPAVSGSTVYIGATDNNVYALDATTGAQLWNYTTGNQVRASPVIANGVLYIASEDGYVYALDASSGAKLWSSPTSPGDSFTCSSPALAGGILYVGAHDGKIYAFIASNGTELWSYTTGNVVESSPAVANGIVYCGSDDGNVYALVAATGALKWSFTTGSPVYSSPAVAGGMVYVGGWNGNVYALDATSGTEIWSYATGSGIFSSPAIANGVMYIGSYDSNLYAFGTYVATSNSSSQSNAEVWVPAPANAVAAVGAAVVLTGAVSLIFSAMSNPLGSFGGKISEKTKGLIPNNLKSWLEDFVSSKQKLHVEEKSGSPFVPTKPEALAYGVAIIVLALAFSYVKASSLAQMVAVLPLILATSVLVAFVKKFFSIAFMRSRGVWSEHKVWPFGLGLFLVTTLAFRVPFSSPTRNVHYSAKFTKQLGVIASASEILIGVLFAGLFFILMNSGFVLVGSTGLAMCIISSFFDTLPIAPMNGKDIYDHNKILWAILFALTLTLYALWLILL
jgi:outer membrane protein assembly factor BamB